MSIEAINWALNHAPCENSTQKLVLFALANHAHPDGTSAFPSVARIMRYTLLSERAIRLHLAGLEELGLIERGDASIVASYINRADRRPQGWNLRLDKISGVPLVQVVEVRGASSAGNGVHLVHERGAGDAPKPYIEPSIEPSSVFMSEAVQLCNLLANLIHENGSRLPKVTNRWIQDMEKIMRLDCRTPQQVEMAIRWCQKSSFWKANILSPSKLRDKYDQLRLQASREMTSHPLSGLSDFLAES